MKNEIILAAYFGDGGYDKLQLAEEDVRKLTYSTYR